jgi:hypothetical protein
MRGVISEERLAKLHKMYGHGTGADTMEEQGPKQTWFHRGPDRQPAASTPHARRAHAPPYAPPSIAEVLVEHLGALRKIQPPDSLTRAWVRQRASTRPGLRRNGRGPLPPMGSLTRDAAARDRGTPCSALGRDVSPAQGGRPVAGGPLTAIQAQTRD